MYNKQVYNTFLAVVKRYLDITVKFINGLVNVMFSKKIDITARFKGVN